MAKGEIAHHEQFHLWPQCFQKSSAAIALKCVWEKVNMFFAYMFSKSSAVEMLFVGKGQEV